MHFRLAIAALLLCVTAAYAQPGNDPVAPSKQLSNLAARNASQALDMTAAPPALPPQPLLPDADRVMPDRPYDPGSIHYPYGRTSLGNVDPASRFNPYGPYARPSDMGPGPTSQQNTLPPPAFALPPPSFGIDNRPAFSRGR